MQKVYKKISNRKFLGSLIGGILFIYCILYFTYAYYNWKSENTNVVLNISDGSNECILGPDVNVSGIGPVLDYRDGVKASFSIIGNSETQIPLYLQINSIDEELKVDYLKYILVYDINGGTNYDYDNPITSGNFAPFDENNNPNGIQYTTDDNNNIINEIISDLPNSLTDNCLYQFIIYIDGTVYNDPNIQNYSLTSSLTLGNCSSSTKIQINKPNLSNDLIPVVYNGDDWIAVNEDSKWYDYDKQQWANAIIPKSNVTISTGDSIDLENDIKGIFVWIPRYEYKIKTDGTNEIDINFISVEKTTASSGYILPDAFTFGTTNVDGIWLGKFETSMDTSTEEIYVIPNNVAVTDQTINTQYNLAMAFNDDLNSTNIDAHMAKNSEWGVAAYLSHSLHGKFGNSNYTGDNKEIYVNDSLGLYTGRSAGNTSSEGSTNGTYNYDDGFTDGTEESGIGASTTGNIYGIYDMSGGAYEYVMGYLTTASSTFGATSTYNAAGFSSTPDSKYYDGYTSSVSSSTPYNSHALGETTNWYGDGSAAISGDTPWYMRGGVADGGATSGIFAYGTTSGYMGSYATFRMALIVNK